MWWASRTFVTARAFLDELRERFAKFGLALHPDKTRLIEFGRFAAERRRRRGQGRPETFDFLGFTHCCGTDQQGKFQVVRLTVEEADASDVDRRSARRSISDGTNLCPSSVRGCTRVLNGYFEYHAVPTNLCD